MLSYEEVIFMKKRKKALGGKGQMQTRRYALSDIYLNGQKEDLSLCCNVTEVS